MILKTKYKLCIFTKDNYEYKTFRASLFRLLSDGDLQVKIFTKSDAIGFHVAIKKQ